MDRLWGGGSKTDPQYGNIRTYAKDMRPVRDPAEILRPAAQHVLQGNERWLFVMAISGITLILAFFNKYLWRELRRARTPAREYAESKIPNARSSGEVNNHVFR